MRSSWRVFVFRELDLAGLWRAFMKAARISATIYLLVAAATLLSYALNLLGLASGCGGGGACSTASRSCSCSPSRLLMLVLGTFLDIGAAILIFVPLLMPAVRDLASIRCRRAWSSC